MAKQKDFDSFLTNIEPSKTTVDYISSVQNNLRDYLKAHSFYKNVHVQTFISGSYAKHTCIRPTLYDGKRDVDIVVETIYDATADSKEVLTELRDILKEKSTYSTARIQDHSVGIELSGIDIDIVPVIIDESGNKYCIGSSQENIWTLTDPKGHISWSSEINASNNMKYKPLVKMIKWWRRMNCPDDIKYPQGIALEKLIADNIADAELNSENLFVATLQNIVAAYKEEYVDKGLLPNIEDPSINDNDLLAAYSAQDFKDFILKLAAHLQLITDNGTTNEILREILGTEFPPEETTSLTKGYVMQTAVQNCLAVPHRQRPSWSIPRGCAALVNAKVVLPNGSTLIIENDDNLLPKGSRIYYTAICGMKPPYSVKWQVVNTGTEAAANSCLRGGFENSNEGRNTRSERTAYTGKHYVQCFIIKNGQCLAKSTEFIIKIQ